MALASFKKEDYMKLAEKKGYIHLGAVPHNMHQKTDWKCIRCGKISRRTYRGVRVGPGCSCKSRKTKQVGDYLLLADKLGIEWVYTYQDYEFPTNSKAMTRWRNPKTGAEVEASWHQLTHNLRHDLALALGLDKEDAD